MTECDRPSSDASKQHRGRQPATYTAEGHGPGPLQMRLNLVDVNGTEFMAEVLPDLTITTDNDALPDGIWALEGNLTEAWDNLDEGANTSIGGDQGP
ncbi:hypothetical protein CROQUDRAFT_94698 [Cronartium quercuum f. sp. fusiforme G11]|uniref:Uncharacterized protein n=1 Tax=Cronartium quercuum f. sp. fusiforme G11 TaxID=708437 RepID=A0A9P6TBM5_9BASI|nr:hypothetical protein CROQUDRAFT_94698 [Cronartium quercuum f. sp. fusiforme G11]